MRKDDTRSDIYFLGCIYYNMLSGRPPLPETRDRIQRLSKQRFLDVVPLRKADSTIPHCVATIVSKAMHLDPRAGTRIHLSFSTTWKWRPGV